MNQALLIVGCVEGELLASDRAAVSLSISRFEQVQAFSPNHDEIALRYAIGGGAVAVTSPQAFGGKILVTGRGAGGDLAVARLATDHDATLILEVLDFEIHGDELRVVRDLGAGAREIMTLKGPVVLVVSEDAVSPLYVSRYRQMSAQLPPARSRSAETELNWKPIRVRTKANTKMLKGTAQARMLATFGLEEKSSAAQILAADAKECARYLVRYLAHHGFVKSSRLAEAAIYPSAEPRESSPSLAPSDFPETRAPQPVEGGKPWNTRGPFRHRHKL